jgi:hypothetical protein
MSTTCDFGPASGLKASLGNDEEWKAWKTIKPVYHPSHSSWKSLRDSHIPNASAAGAILITDRAQPALPQNQSHSPRKGLVNNLPGTKRKTSVGTLRGRVHGTGVKSHTIRPSRKVQPFGSIQL